MSFLTHVHTYNRIRDTDIIYRDYRDPKRAVMRNLIRNFTITATYYDKFSIHESAQCRFLFDIV